MFACEWCEDGDPHGVILHEGERESRAPRRVFGFMFGSGLFKWRTIYVKASASTSLLDVLSVFGFKNKSKSPKSKQTDVNLDLFDGRP